MGLFSGAKLFGMTIRESATDGSDFTNPDADYRRLFLGEDGQLHVKDSAGAVTDIGSATSNVATDTIWDAAGDLAVGSGANTAAVLTKGAAGGVLAMGNSAVIWNSGTSFPASKATGDRYWRSDLALEFYWDGTRWVSSTLYTAGPGAFDGSTTANLNGWPESTSGAVVGRMALWHADFAIWLVSLYATTYVQTTNSGSHYWTVSIVGGVTATSYGGVSTAADSADAYTGHSAALNVAAGATERSLNLTVTKTAGTPGAIYAPSIVTYRLIGA
jgi:hypothetical protein